MKFSKPTIIIDDLELIEIMDIRIINSNKMIVIPSTDFANVITHDWRTLKTKYHLNNEHKNLLHIVYRFQDNIYRAVLSENQPLQSMLDFKWIQTGFHNDIEDVQPSWSPTDHHLTEIIKQNSGPLGDFYTGIGILQHADGFLDLTLTKRLIRKGHHIDVTDVLGEIKTFTRID